MLLQFWGIILMWKSLAVTMPCDLKLTNSMV